MLKSYDLSKVILEKNIFLKASEIKRGDLSWAVEDSSRVPNKTVSTDKAYNRVFQDRGYLVYIENDLGKKEDICSNIHLDTFGYKKESKVIINIGGHKYQLSEGFEAYMFYSDAKSGGSQYWLDVIKFKFENSGEGEQNISKMLF